MTHTIAEIAEVLRRLADTMEAHAQATHSVFALKHRDTTSVCRNQPCASLWPSIREARAIAGELEGMKPMWWHCPKHPHQFYMEAGICRLRLTSFDDEPACDAKFVALYAFPAPKQKEGGDGGA